MADAEADGDSDADGCGDDDGVDDAGGVEGVALADGLGQAGRSPAVDGTPDTTAIPEAATTPAITETIQARAGTCDRMSGIGGPFVRRGCHLPYRSPAPADDRRTCQIVVRMRHAKRSSEQVFE